MEERPPEPTWLFYVLSFIEPVAGIVVGVIFMGKSGPANGEFGKACLYVALARFLLTFLLIVLAVFAYVMIALAFFVGPVLTYY
jgi:hypothetical protein